MSVHRDVNVSIAPQRTAAPVVAAETVTMLAPAGSHVAGGGVWWMDDRQHSQLPRFGAGNVKTWFETAMISAGSTSVGTMATVVHCTAET
jgi:hypothetical protein